MIRNYRSIALAVISSFAVSQVDALPTAGKDGTKRNLMKTAANCSPATAVIDLDINNVRARLMTGGDMWWDQGPGIAAYEVPKGSRKNALYAGSCWVGGIQNGSLKTAAQTYRQDGNDYWPGPLNTNNGTYEITREECNEWDKFWKIDRVVVNEFKQLSDYSSAVNDERFRNIFEWPARGNGDNAPGNNAPLNSNTRKAKGTTGAELLMDDREYAPFVDLNGNGIYNPEEGEYPNMEDPGRGDQMVWWVFNDRGNAKLQTKSESIGLEIQTSAFAFSTKDFLNDATFYNYRVINRAGLTLDSAYMATWTDADLGIATDDYIGCDTARGLGILYNATPTDGNGEPNSYGENPPMVGVDFFIGPLKRILDPVTGLERNTLLKMQAFTYFINRGAGNPPVEIQDPNTSVEFYFYMTGSRKSGTLFSYDYVAPNITCNGLGAGSGDKVRFVFAGDVNSGWSECVCKNAPGDRRFIHSAGPFQLRPGDVNDIVIGAVWVPNAGGCPNASFGKIRVADDLTQELFDNNFKTIEGPETPRVVYREMDRKIIFYLQNDYLSTNFQEKYGYDLDSAKYRVRVAKAARTLNPDSLYKFEGYRMFQLRDALITPAQIFNEKGELDETVAREVFQCDIKNGVKRIVNWTKNTEIEDCNNCFTPIVKVNGSDTGLAHSFELTQDAFATGTDKQLVNYKSYYYITIAYGYNNFTNFDQFDPESTQDRAYIESAHGPNGSPLGDQILTIMPNPANGNMGTALNADYGTGVVIQKMEGVGNGALDIQLDEFSEEQALSATTGYQSTQPTYVGGRGPAKVMVVDPLKVKPGNWKLYLIPDLSQTGAFANGENIINGNAAKWQLIKDGDFSNPIYSERNLEMLNEQIIEDYGLSITMAQTVRPGDDQTEKSQNGYITSEVIYDNPNIPWLTGVKDGEKVSPVNWIRSGGTKDDDPTTPPPCAYNDNDYDSLQYYENMLSNSSQTAATWAPYSLGAYENRTGCGFGITYLGSGRILNDLQSVDIVFTSDKSKWSRCAVIELTDDLDANKRAIVPYLSEGNTPKFRLRSHNSWNGDVDGSGAPIYASRSGGAEDTGFSMFPGYAINQETGERLNIVFGEASYFQNENGRDMIWNPTANMYDNSGGSVFGGKHFVYIANTKYDGCKQLAQGIASPNEPVQRTTFESFIWAGMPLANNLLSVKDGLIPTTTRLRFRVTRPYAYYAPPGVSLDNTGNVPGFPKYQFTTNDLVPNQLSDADNPYNSDKKKLLDRMHVVPNPYYAYNGYEKNRLDTRVRIINLPNKATVHVYSLDGSLIRKLTKDDNLAYIDWDIRNAKSLPIASGMYLIHIKAEGIGEKVVKWFGAMRPVDVTSY